MKAQIIKLAVKAGPIMKKGFPIVASAVGAVVTALSDQKEAARMDNFEQRIKDLEELLKNK